ncbi:uncharacterized protein LACBIDRAFT_304291 [Laccaria bicolor S238N-H82]|uniref:Predicted protein n=1 Tax=Laccaria bicolor (strain S238N-H82 / ATCC MYA-4686) TaxID=486041 RepID=B0DLB1_LACBS|nr:uncharacterized protein LACBIDRAFT_304291 [Laccaria bicolor S238N-H82]EDR04620.1 predicted protein [Laccaria bicolor S238N-H82]|eukprot:XP_001884792.1 predicted protein [Laccaria bicolor S238N-H82]
MKIYDFPLAIFCVARSAFFIRTRHISRSQWTHQSRVYKVLDNRRGRQKSSLRAEFRIAEFLVSSWGEINLPFLFPT